MADVNEQTELSEPKKKSAKGVLPSKLSAGPHGIGDPNDKTLRKAETEVTIPERVRQKTRKEKCHLEMNAFAECGKEAGLMIWYDCKSENQKYIDCATKWFYDKEFVAQVTQEYLEERSEYRRTGVGKKQQKLRQSMP